RACRAGLAMQHAMPGFNAERTIKLVMRIGINTGPIVRGDLGSKVVRRDYTVIGDTVNQANRYEAKCPHGAVLVSASTRDAVGPLGTFREAEGLQLKGVAAPVTGYVVETMASEEPE
ncbi:MAG: adenylate/guanylate cyclase domain-containing protein, partial [Deltaproteobacteria bacterium]|nr:adenylate/guanylate cyclase domain-containing protein [Deltaproteobacteria bacterium]